MSVLFLRHFCYKIRHYAMVEGRVRLGGKNATNFLPPRYFRFNEIQKKVRSR